MEPMNYICGCCEGTEVLPPLVTVNRPGLQTLAYRIGTHATFLETMKARLSSSDFPSLSGLKTRNASDAAIALLDAWATVADVLTFYQERIANEGYLRTATERRSVLELARLVGYSLRPGVAATVYPAFTLEVGYNKDSKVPAGTRIQSLPDPGEMPQFFETSETIEARTDWNNLQARLSRPSYITLNRAKADEKGHVNQEKIEPLENLYFEGIFTNLKANDPLLLVFGNQPDQLVVRQVKTLEAQPAENRTAVQLQPIPASTNLTEIEHFPPLQETKPRRSVFEALGAQVNFNGDKTSIVGRLQEPPSRPPANAFQLLTSPTETYRPASDVAPKLLATLKPALKDTLYTAWANTQVTVDSDLSSLHALRVKAAPFGANAQKPVLDNRGVYQGSEEWAIATNLLKIGISFTPQRDPSGFPATISIKRGDTTESRQITLPNSETPTELEVNNIPTTIQVSDNFLAFTFAFPDQDRRHTVALSTDGNRRIVVAIDEDSWVIPPGETVRQTTWDNRQIVIATVGNPASDRIAATAGLPYSSILIQEESPAPVADRTVLALDAQYDLILPRSWVVVERPDNNQPTGKKQQVFQVIKTETITKTDYGISGKVTQLHLNGNWLEPTDLTLDKIRPVTVYAQSEELKLTEEAIAPVLEPVQGSTIELSTVYDGLKPGRWLIVSGERTDLVGATGVKASELVMLSSVIQDVAKVKDANGNETELKGDKTHTFLQLAESLKYQYKRDTVTIYGNVIKATHGETRPEVLGSGNGSQPFQQFTLRQPPLTYVAAPTPRGTVSTLELRVNNLLWHETDSFVGHEPGDRVYATKTDDDSKTTVIFGNGINGARLPTGMENVRATYRVGIGKAGNVKAEQISQLASRPPGLKSVINPLPATGGADREGRDQARQNAPLAVMSLDRLVSVQDYADFARTFAGIGKTSAKSLSNGRHQVVHLTIAGADDIPIDPSSDLYRNLLRAIQHYGDPFQPIQINSRELLLLVVSANVKIQADYLWEVIAQQIRDELYDRFSFEHQNLGEDVTLSEVIRIIQSVPGIAYVDIDLFDTVSETEAADPTRLIDKLLLLTQASIAPNNSQGSDSNAEEAQITLPKPRVIVKLARTEKDPTQRFLPDQLIQPAQLAILSPTVPEMLNLQEVKS